VFNTPGYNKRRLTRDANKQINSGTTMLGLRKEDVKMERLPIISLTKPKVEEVRKSEVVVVDPLMKFWKPPEDNSKKVRKSIDFLQKLGGSIKEETKNTSQDIFAIPDFKPKSFSRNEMSFKVKSKSTGNALEKI
jgi:hypothetical protein